MTLPDIDVAIADSPGTRIVPSSSGNFFITGVTERGLVGEPIAIASPAGSKRLLGDRLAATPHITDTIDVFLREAGGGSIFFSRLVGEDAATAEGSIEDDGGDEVLKISANSPGAWGNDLGWEITGGSGVGSGDDDDPYTIEVSYKGELVEVSPEMETLDQAVAWASASSDYVVVEKTAEVEENPAAGTGSLAGGDDDADAVDIATGLAVFTPDLGAGHVAAPGFTTLAAHTAVLEHADTHKRIPLLDLVDAADEGVTQIAEAKTRRTLAGHKFAGPLAPWDIVPGLAPGTSRTVPPCARAAALHARTILQGGSAGDPAAGEDLPSRYVTGLTQSFNDEQREALNDAGVNVSVVRGGEVVQMGNRTLANPLSEPNWAQLSQARVICALAAIGREIGRKFVHKKVDGGGVNVGKFVGRLDAECLEFVGNGDLFPAPDGSDPGYVITPSVDIEADTATILGTIEARVAPGADRVEITIVKTPIA